MSTADPQDVVLAFRTPNYVEANSLAIYLDDAGIKSKIVGEFLDGVYPGLSMGRMNDKEVWVAAKDATAVEQLVGEWRRDNHLNGDVTADGMSWPLRVMCIIALLTLLAIGLQNVN